MDGWITKISTTFAGRITSYKLEGNLQVLTMLLNQIVGHEVLPQL